MKRLKLSIEKTIEAMVSYKAIDYEFFRRMCVAGMIADGFEYIELDPTGDWVHCLDRKAKKWLEIDLYKYFDKLTVIETKVLTQKP